MRLMLLHNKCLKSWICPNLLLSGIILLTWIFLPSFFYKHLSANEVLNGYMIMDQVTKRHELYPYVFEEQTMILMDNASNRNVRKLRRFSLVEKNGTAKYLLVVDDPVEVRGVALLAVKQYSGNMQGGIYLPAFGKELISNSGNNRGNSFLDTDFAIEDLTVENLTDFRYERVDDINMNNVDYFVVESFPQNEEVEQNTGYSLRRHYIRQDNFFIIRTDYFDRRGRFLKQQTCHDVKRVDGTMWRANMVLMKNFKIQHKTLIKINRRIFSRDYVPAEMFTTDWLLQNRHIQNTEIRLFKNHSKPVEETNNKFEDVHQENRE